MSGFVVLGETSVFLNRFFTFKGKFLDYGGSRIGAKYLFFQQYSLKNCHINMASFLTHSPAAAAQPTTKEPPIAENNMTPYFLGMDFFFRDYQRHQALYKKGAVFERRHGSSDTFSRVLQESVRLMQASVAKHPFAAAAPFVHPQKINTDVNSSTTTTTPFYCSHTFTDRRIKKCVDCGEFDH